MTESVIGFFCPDNPGQQNRLNYFLLMFTRRLLQTICLLPVLALALEAEIPMEFPQFKALAGRKTVLIHTGNAALDDAIEEGFRLHWKFTPWSWAADTGMPKLKNDSSMYVFGNFPMYRWRQRGLFGCQDGWRDDKNGTCVLQDSASSFSLYWVKGETHREILSEISELRSWPSGDAMAIDVIRDFQTALQTLNDSTADAMLLNMNREWPGLIASFPARQTCATCTVWVAREYGKEKPLDTAKMSELLSRPVQLIGMDSLDGLLGTPRQGLYLDAGSRSTFARNLHLRTLDSGVLVATTTRRVGGQIFLPKGMDLSDFKDLGHRLKGEEERVVFSLSWFGQFSGNTLAQFVQGGYEFHRGWHALGGFGTTYDLVGSEEGQTTKLSSLLAGIRWHPLLGYEANALTNRAVFDLALQLPLGEGKDAATIENSWYYTSKKWNAPPMLILSAITNVSILELGAGFQFPLGEEYTQSGFVDDVGAASNAQWNLRVGIRTEWRGWRKAPSLFIPRK